MFSLWLRGANLDFRDLEFLEGVGGPRGVKTELFGPGLPLGALWRGLKKFSIFRFRAKFSCADPLKIGRNLELCDFYGEIGKIRGCGFGPPRAPFAFKTHRSGQFHELFRLAGPNATLEVANSRKGRTRFLKPGFGGLGPRKAPEPQILAALGRISVRGPALHLQGKLGALSSI